jgi:hypothetical protein
VQDMSDAIRAIQAKQSSNRSLTGIGVGAPGPLELPEGILRNHRIFTVGMASTYVWLTIEWGTLFQRAQARLPSWQAKGTNRFGVVSFLGAIFSGRPHGAYQYTSEEESVKHGIFCPIHVHVAKASQLGLPSY